MRHRIKHHVNRPVLHWGLFTDRQMLPAATLAMLGLGWGFAGSGGLVARTAVACLFLLPVGVIVLDNRLGGIALTWLLALLRWRSTAGVFAPESVEEAEGYVLSVDAQDQLVLEREALARVELDIAFAEDA
jgi:hypothetical protein